MVDDNNRANWSCKTLEVYLTIILLSSSTVLLLAIGLLLAVHYTVSAVRTLYVWCPTMRYAQWLLLVTVL